VYHYDVRKGERSDPGFSEDELIETYSYIVRRIARQFYLAGGYSEDLVQEGMVGLLSAIRSYDEARGVPFEAYASLCVRRRIISAVRLYSKNEPVAAIIEEETGGEEPGIEQSIIDREGASELIRQLPEILSGLEQRVLDLYLEGTTYNRIAETLGISVKSVDNAVQRTRKKLMNLIRNQLS